MNEQVPSKERVDQAIFWAKQGLGFGDRHVLAKEVERLREEIAKLETHIIERPPLKTTCEKCIELEAELAIWRQCHSAPSVAQINAAVDERLDRVERELAATYIEGTNGLGISGPWCSDCGTKQGYGHLVGCEHSGPAQPPGDGQ